MDNDFATGYALGADSNNGCNGNGNGMWGDGGWWTIILFAMIFGWGNGGWGGFGGGNGGMMAAANGALTRSDLCNEFSFNDLQNGVRNVNDSVNVGFANLNSTICHQQYDTAQLVNGVNNNLMQGFHGVDNAVCQLGYQTQQGFNNANVVALQNQNALQTQLSSCCCENRQGQADIKFQMATDTCAIQNTIQNTTRDIIDNQNANYRGLMDWMVQRDMDALRAENQNLKLAASQAAQNSYLVDQLRPAAKPAYITCSPFASSYGFGYGYNGYNGYSNGNCGCNSGCCGCNG